MISNFRSMKPQTPFTPEWNINIWFSKYENKDNLKIMKSWILENESVIIEKHKSKEKHDGGTGLGEKSLTANFIYFDLFYETRNIDAFVDYKKFVESEYRKFCKELKIKDEKCFIISWANVAKNKQKIHKHNHGATHYAYLSGNCHLDNYETETIYHNPYDHNVRYTVPNVEGGLTLFPSYLYHSSTEHKEKNDRISVAFDILVEEISPKPESRMTTKFNNI